MGRPVNFLTEYITALQFLTRIRLVKNPDCDERSFGRSVAFFPLVGVTAGVLLALVALATGGWLPSGLRTTLLVTLMVYVTGGLHCDGLMDTADGVLSGRSPERMLEIMKDSRVGAFGVIAAVLLLLWKWSLAHDMPSSLLAPALVCMMAFARFGMVLVILRFPYVREDGMGRAFKQHADSRAAWFSLATLILVLAGLQFFYGRFVLMAAVIAIAAVILFSLALGRWLTAKLGGLSGDMYGAITELNEVLVLAVFVLSAFIR